MLDGELLQGADELAGAGQAEGDGLPAGFPGALAAGLGIPPAPLAVGGQRVVGLVVAVLGPGAAVAAGRGGGLAAAGVGAVLGGDGCRCHAVILFHFVAMCNDMN
ncbi:MAG: hypothetical protein ACRDNT_11750 [Streptosporangiaceae bacterium]